MEHANRFRRTEFVCYPECDFVNVAVEVDPAMCAFVVQRVLAVIAHIEQDQVVALRERQPEWRICIDRKTVAMT